jgi:hypothetical protein
LLIAALALVASSVEASSGLAQKADFVLNVAPRKNQILSVSNDKNLGEGLSCDVCIQFAVEGINILLNYILDNVIIGDCGSLCGSLSKLGKIEVDICDGLCDTLGVAEFVELLKKFSNDIDPIYFCQLVKMCLVEDCNSPPCATVLELAVEPQYGTEESTFSVNATVQITQAIGAGMVRFEFGSSEETIESDGLVTEYNVGTYLFSLAMPAESYYYTLTPGNWTVGVLICEGMCGSTFPNSALLAEGISWLVVQ